MNSNNELVSVILPVYNAEMYLAESITSIINQTYQNLQILIINDGSTDKSLDIINTFNDERLMIISRENKGLIYSLNEGLAYAKGNFIARMDADDISSPDRIQKQLDFLIKHKNIAVVGSYAKLIDENNNVIGTRTPSKFNFLLKATCRLGAPFIHPSIMFNKKLINKQLFYSSEFTHAEDYELWSRLSLQKELKFANIPEYLLMYRILMTSVSRKNSEKQSEITVKIQKKYFIKSKYKDTSNTTDIWSILFKQKLTFYIIPQLVFKIKMLIKKKTRVRIK